VGGSPATLTFDYSFTGVDPQCRGPQDAQNACGVHVHAGTSCSDESRVLGHYFKVSSDPWLSVAYVATADGAASGSVEVTTGGSLSDFAGRAFVVHDAQGRRIACGLLHETAASDTLAVYEELGCAGAIAGGFLLGMLATPLLLVCYRLVCKSGSAARRHVVPRHVSPNVVEIRAPPIQQPNPPAAARAEGASALPGWGVEVVGAA